MTNETTQNDLRDTAEDMIRESELNLVHEDADAPAHAEENKDAAPEETASSSSAVTAETEAAGAGTVRKTAKAPSRVKKCMEARKAKKAEAKAERVSKDKRRRFDIEALQPDQRELALASIADVHTIGRKTASHIFELGDAFERMASAIPDPQDWKEAVQDHCKLSYKSADNWRAVAAALGHRRDEFVRHAVTPTVLIKLTKAQPEQIDRVIEAFEAGRPMKVKDVEAMVRSGEAEAEAAAGTEANGGLKVLKALALAKVARQSKGFAANLKAIRAALVAAMKAAGAKRLKKGELVAELSPLARQAHRDLTELLCEIDPASLLGGQALRHQKAPDKRWAGVVALLYRLGGDHWAEASELKAFVAQEVLPTLAFVLDGTDEKAPGSEPTAETSAGSTRTEGEDEEASPAQTPSAASASQEPAATQARGSGTADDGSILAAAVTEAAPRRRVSQATLDRRRQAEEEASRSYDLYQEELEREALREMEEREADDRQRMIADFAAGKFDPRVLVPGLAAFEPGTPIGTPRPAAGVGQRR